MARLMFVFLCCLCLRHQEVAHRDWLWCSPTITSFSRPRWASFFGSTYSQSPADCQKLLRPGTVRTWTRMVQTLSADIKFPRTELALIRSQTNHKKGKKLEISPLSIILFHFLRGNVVAASSLSTVIMTCHNDSVRRLRADYLSENC
jgi:hypothetical protein